MQPDVSIVMPAFNSENYIGPAVQSVWQQSHSNWELLIVDDDSTDATRQLAAQFSRFDNRIKLIEGLGKVGAAAARNAAIEYSRGNWVAFLDSDDIWHPAKLEKQLRFLANSGSPITFGDYLRVTSDGRAMHRVRAPVWTDYGRMLRSNFIGNLTAIYDRRRFPELRFESCGNEDYVFWLTALRLLDSRILSTPSEEPLASYRVRASSLSGNKFRSALWQWETYRRRLGYGRLQSAVFMGSYAYYGMSKRLPHFGELLPVRWARS
ncbi:glycosyltransferase family 2 protein [Pelagibacterium montanilacus]|uniref:glycosyltransferase family 2 protein n=1 Tax=Pelagibacterium montanilacus TaxID=2185280 RepID=UPI000F8D2D95|nr:glycosyltransferase family 2 protein [Pelagibacterium montanilacus]